VVCTGVGLGLLTLWMFATVSLKLVERFPILKHTAFLLIGYVGIILLVEMTAEYAWHEHLHITPFQKFIGLALIIVLSLWYARDAKLRRACAPVFKASIGPAKVYSKVTGTVLAVLAWPFKAVWGVMRRKPAVRSDEG
jgi:hypothetical protein